MASSHHASLAQLSVSPLSGRQHLGPKLLPAFEPMSSSPPPMLRPFKRKFDETQSYARAGHEHYPTPVPTSDTAVLPSSPPGALKTRPGMHRTLSAMTERQPLGTVPSLSLPADGKELLMGRSSNSSHHQLSANRAISRIHVRASYIPSTEEQEIPKVLVECLGWNGCKIHCLGQIHELAKGDTFASEKPHADLMLDVQDTRVMLRWPSVQETLGQDSESDASPIRRNLMTPQGDLSSSPPLPRGLGLLQSPISPSPRNLPQHATSSTFVDIPQSSPTRDTVHVYEDASGDEPEEAAEETQRVAESSKEAEALATKSSDSSSPLSSVDDFSEDNDEENDPVVHAFGSSGDNLLPRMASINATSPVQQRRPLKDSASPQRSPIRKPALRIDISPIRNHVINQLAFGSRNSTPLSTIFGHLPASMKTIDESKTSPDSDAENKPLESPKKRQLTDAELKQLLEETPCIGEIAREGKDAAGKKLEDEFYYVPRLDSDEGRRNAVEQQLGKPGLRSVRKQHKQYYWKKPRN